MSNIVAGYQPSSTVSGNARSGHIAILLTTYNGARFLEEQLNSIIHQTYRYWTLYVSDDGSSDATRSMLRHYQDLLEPGRIHVFEGPRQGFAQNFLSLVRHAEVDGDYFAFSDQDDVWYEDKLERSLDRLPVVSCGRPALYCSRTRLIDESGSVIGCSPLFTKAPSFRNALVQSLAGANTMLFNKAARSLLARIPNDAHVVSHDWLAYLLVSGCGGEVFYDPAPTLDYRQHGGNLIGSNVGFADRLLRIRKMFGGTFREWNRHNLYALSACRGQLESGNRTALECFERARESDLLRRFVLLVRAGVYRQTVMGNIGLAVATCIRRI